MRNLIAAMIAVAVIFLIILAPILTARSYNISSLITKETLPFSLTPQMCCAARDNPQIQRSVNANAAIHIGHFQKFLGSKTEKLSIPEPNYDEQIGLTFTESFRNLSWNVSAIKQQDSYGYGPAYLLNGLTDKGYWYQLGIAWDWPYRSGGGYNPGFTFIYEVWDSAGNSIYPYDGGGGVATFSDIVNPGDTVFLTMNFQNGDVIMRAYDLNTHASALENYSSEGASKFVGLQSSFANSNGYFSGLMTEKYYVNAYYGSQERVLYSNSNQLSSAWMWIDEFVSNNSTLILFSGSKFVSYTDPNLLQAYSLQGATEFSNAYNLITGINYSQVPITISYSTQDYSVPSGNLEFTYYHDGTQQSTFVSTTPATLEVDVGSKWQVTSTIAESQQEWVNSQNSSGTVSTPINLNFIYYHEYRLSFGYKEVGGGSDYSPPTVQYMYLGRLNTAQLGSFVWTDAGSSYSLSNPLNGSTSNERWYATNSSGVIQSSGEKSVTYYHQYTLTGRYSVVGGDDRSSTLTFYGISTGLQSQFELTTSPTVFWLDAGSRWNLSNILNNSNSNERWVTADQTFGTVSQAESLDPTYYHQYLEQIIYSFSGGNNTSSIYLNATQFGKSLSIQFSSNTLFWEDAYTNYNIPKIIRAFTIGERWITNTSSFNATSHLTVDVTYIHQFYVNFNVTPSIAGFTNNTDGWYNEGSGVTLSVYNNSGFEFHAWTGLGSSAYNGSDPNHMIIVSSQFNETAMFYVGIKISCSRGGSLTYSDGLVKGKVSPGSSITIYVPPGSTLAISESASSILYTFKGWSGVTSSQTSISINPTSPITFKGQFGLNLPVIATISIVVVLTSFMLLLVKFRRRTSIMTVER